MEQRLSKRLAGAGVASRRGAEELIFSGRVAVNGAVVLKPETRVTQEDRITVDGKKIASAESKVYYMLNKPKGLLCSTDVANSVLNLFPSNKRLFTVGRLDKDTEGLLLVTNDGDFANRVIHPRYNHHKEYILKTDREINHHDLVALSKGGWVENAFVKPVRVTKVRRGTVKIVVSEGKKREVRLLAEKAGLEVVDLKRVRIGNLHLGTLPIGTWRALTEQEKEIFLNG